MLTSWLRQGLRNGTCPLCRVPHKADREYIWQVNAGYLLDELATSSGYRETFAASPGLCFPHFELAWNGAQSRSDREVLLATQRKAARKLLHDVSEHVRKHDDKYRHEPKGSERDSWQRAIFLTAGWPPPAATAGEPEDARKA